MKLFRIIFIFLVSNYLNVFGEKLFALDFPGAEEQMTTADIQVNLKIGLFMINVKIRSQN